MISKRVGEGQETAVTPQGYQDCSWDRPTKGSCEELHPWQIASRHPACSTARIFDKGASISIAMGREEDRGRMDRSASGSNGPIAKNTSSEPSCVLVASMFLFGWHCSNPLLPPTVPSTDFFYGKTWSASLTLCWHSRIWFIWSHQRHVIVDLFTAPSPALAGIF